MSYFLVIFIYASTISTDMKVTIYFMDYHSSAALLFLKRVYVAHSAKTIGFVNETESIYMLTT